MKKKHISNLDTEEKELAQSFNKGEWHPVANITHEKTKAKKAAENYVKKAARINIRISMADLEQIKQKAAYEGLPYQTLIASILHKYAAGHLSAQQQ